jgi:hypothetical protein
MFWVRCIEIVRGYILPAAYRKVGDEVNGGRETDD